MMDRRHFDIDLASESCRRIELPGAVVGRATVWLRGRPLGRLETVAQGGWVDCRDLVAPVVRALHEPLLKQLMFEGLSTPGLETLGLEQLFELRPTVPPVEPGQLTVAILTDAAESARLRACLEALASSSVAPAEVLVVVRGTGSVAPRFDGSSIGLAGLRWISEPGADLARARQVALAAVGTRLVAFLDDEVRVDRGWAEAICRTFEQDPAAMAVAGSVLVDGLESEPSLRLGEACERLRWHGPFERRRVQARPRRRLARKELHAGDLGSASNMAYRMEVFTSVGGFHALADGMADAESQHLDLWLRILDSGFAVVYEPAACVRRNGGISLADATARMRATAAGITCALVAAAARRPGRAFGVLMLLHWFIRTALGRVVRDRGAGRALAQARIRGHLAGLWAGVVGALRGRVARTNPSDAGASGTGGPVKSGASTRDGRADGPFQHGRVEPIELSIPAGDAATAASDDLASRLSRAREVDEAEILALWRGQVLGRVGLVTSGRPITSSEVLRVVVEAHFASLMARHLDGVADAVGSDGFSLATDREAALGRVRRSLERLLLARWTSAAAPKRPPGAATVSILVPTCDRPDDLRECMASIVAQKSSRSVEVIVVDNGTDHAVTAAVVAEFPNVRLVTESRRGASYCRNRGLRACRGSIVVLCDDDVVVPEGWLERLLAPFEDLRVGIVTGNILPRRLATDAERLNERSASLSRGTERFAVDGDWFHAQPTAIEAWRFGTTANAAVRIDLFQDPAVGLFAESLGPGTPTGAGEDPYFFYRALRAGYRIHYEPDAWVWHKHRSTYAHLRRQAYNYAKSAVAYYLMTLLRDNDARALDALAGGLQRHYLRRFLAAIRARADVPAWLVLVEIAGHVAGGAGFVASEVRRRRLARPDEPTSLPRGSTGGSTEDASAPWIVRRKVGRLPHFLVIGAQKAGTTALHSNLRKHPRIEMVPNFYVELPGWRNTKETHFFAGHGSFGLRTLDDYRALFNDNGKLQGESCPDYSRPGAISRIAAAIPDARLVYVCREPVSRIESAANHMYQWHGANPEITAFSGWIPTLPFQENLRRELADPRIYGLLRMGIYADDLERVFEHFPREQVLVLVAEEYRAHPQRIYDRIFDFLGIERTPIAHHDTHVREYTNRLTPEERDWLADFYRPQNERLFRILGRRIAAWSEEERSVA